MLCDETDYLLPYIVAIDGMDVQVVQKRVGWRDSLFFVIDRPDTAVDECRRRGLAEVVTQGAEHHHNLLGPWQIVNPPSRLIDHLEGMHPHITFGMPFGLLRTPDKCQNFGKELSDDSELEREAEANRRTTRKQEFFNLAPDPFRRQIVERNHSTNLLCLLVQLEFEPRGEL